MPQLTRNWYFEPRPAREEAEHADRDDDTAPGLICVPAALLQRHGARVLNPGDAAVFRPRQPQQAGHHPATPRSTVYRARTLLIPADLIQDPGVVRAIDDALAVVGMSIVPPALNGRQVRSSGPAGEVLRRLPRPVVLGPAAPERGRPARPGVVDAWTALQALRAAADAEDGGGDGKADGRADDDAAGRVVLTRQLVRRIALEHLLVGSAISGSPSTEGNGISGSPSTEGNGLAGPGATDSYVYNGGDTRSPVALSLPAPARRALQDCGSRRPVVAVLDTGLRAHPWLDVRPEPPGYAMEGSDPFVAVDQVLQDAIYLESDWAASQGDWPRQPIKNPWDTPISDDPLLGELNDASGHGTFIAGIVRQIAPDAQVLAIRIMHSDDIVYEGDLLCALALLAERIAVAEAGDMTGMVDVVSLSLGYFDESSADVHYSSGLWQVIKLLLDMGVAVVAAAGNYSTSRRFYPAAFTLQPPPGPVPLISVGALNPNGSKAIFSDGGGWVWAWAAGAAVLSTFPTDINGSRCPELRVRAHPANEMPPGVQLPADRQALDPDNYRGGFAMWSGTSFSAPLLAARIARQLLPPADEPAPVTGLGKTGAHAAADRTVAALEKIHWQG